MKRQLATIQLVKDIQTIPTTKYAGVINIKGWRANLSKYELKEGDLCVFLEPDALLPDEPDFAFMKTDGVMQPVRPVRTKLGLVEGLVLPLSMFEKYLPEKIEIGTDLTDRIGVKEYYPDQELYIDKNAVKDKPDFIPRFSCEAIQNCEGVFNSSFLVTEKLNGSPATFYWKGGRFGICSSRKEVDINYPSAYRYIVKLNDLDWKFEAFRKTVGYDFALQGEIIGEGIRGNFYKIRMFDFYGFNFINLEKKQTIAKYTPNHCFGRWRDEEIDLYVASDFFNLKTVPVIREGCLPDNPESILEEAIGRSQISDVIRYGIVYRDTDDISLSPLCFECKNPEYRLANWRGEKYDNRQKTKISARSKRRNLPWWCHAERKSRRF